MNPVNIGLKALSEKIRKYLSGEDVPDKPLHLSGVKNRLRLMPDGLQTVPDPDFEAAYKKAWDLALEIKQAYIGLPKLPSYESNPDVGLRYLLEWCIDASGGKAGDTTQATPETDTKLIYQSDAAEFYNIPKSTLSKAANKKSGEQGYLWSGHKGRRVFLRKCDCQKLSQSRTKLRNI